MLYRTNWQELQYSGISLRSLIAWLETMPADKSYDYCAPTGCLAAQYLRSLGVKREDSWVDFGDRGENCPWLHRIVSGLPWAFGAALERARMELSTE